MKTPSFIPKKTLFLIVFLLFFYHLSAQERSDTIHVKHYDIHLSVLDMAGHTLQGNTHLTVQSKINNLQQIVLDLAAFTVDSVKIANTSTSFTRTASKISIPLFPSINENDTLNITVWYHGIPEQDPSWGGFYFSGEYAYNMGVAMTRIPHNYGRCWFPCIDLFTDKSTYTFNIKTQTEKKAICGGVFLDTIPNGDQTTTWQWALYQPIPSYLASVAVGNYQCFRDTVLGIEKNIPIEIYTYPTQIQNVVTSFQHLKQVVSVYESLFGPYRFDKVGYVGVNFNGGAMEHATNIGYPNYAINGNLNNESLWTHELSHSWFGNLFTCEKAEEMWLNEGFARYCELLTDEHLYPNPNPEVDAAKVGFRTLLRSVLKTTHTTDGGYFALNDVPLNKTYGSTTYDKGALIAHTLRHYMGDTLFFEGIKAIFQKFAFKNINTTQFFAHLAQTSGLPMQDFADAWVNQPGFLHFAIDSIRPSQTPDYYNIHIKQRLHHANQLGNNNRLEITFYNLSGNSYATSVNCSGATDVALVYIPFQPLFGIIDLNEKMADATIDYNLTIDHTGNYSCTDANFTVNMSQIPQNITLFRVEHNLVAPDPLRQSHENIYRLSENHYWHIEYLAAHPIEAVFSFRYYTAAAAQIDYNLLQGYTLDNLILLYRRDASQEWGAVPFTRQGMNSGYLQTTHILPGEYTLAAGLNTSKFNSLKKEEGILIFPNPTQQQLEYKIPSYQHFNKAEIFDNSGKKVKSVKISTNNGIIPLSKIASGMYFIRFYGVEEVVVKNFVVNG
ncbi:MAG: T9SS type A sorting domain-containing protein [Bacteroidales bacterium]|jgi:aminopeptidase N|nr:T9SS type A sorting domain-containing protein [Bacteroidales bacterium]